MTDIVDLGERRAVRNMDPHLASRDPETGALWFTFGVEFDHDGEVYCVRLMAPSWAEAERMVESLRASGRVYGQIMGEVMA